MHTRALGGIEFDLEPRRGKQPRPLCIAAQVPGEIYVSVADTGGVFETLIPRNVRLSEAPSYGKPITEYDRHCVGAAAYRNLAKEFLKRQKTHEAEVVAEALPTLSSVIASAESSEEKGLPAAG